MCRNQLLLISISCALGFGAARANEPSTAAPGGASLPHPDILQLPPDTSTPVAARGLPGASVPANGTALVAPAAVTPAGGPAPVAEDDREIARRPDRAATPAGGNGGASIVRRSAGGFSVFGELWPLLVVLSLVGGGALFLKRYLPKNRLSVGSDVLRVVARTSVGPKQQVMLVKLGRRLVLLGVTPERVNTLTTVEDADQVAMLLGEAATTRPDSMTRAFAASMSQEAGSYEAIVDDEDVTETTRGNVQGLLQKVRQLAGKNG